MSIKLLIAASGTGGHLFPAIATAEQLTQLATDCQVEWLGVPDRLETKLVPACYPLHTIDVEGFQGKPGLETLKTLGELLASIIKVRQLLRQGQFQGVFTTGGYIAAPAIIAARWLALPAILHESNALPGKVTRLLSPWCSTVALGFAAAAQSLPRAKTVVVGTPVRSQFFQPPPLDIPIPDGVPLLVVVGGSQGAIAINQLVRACVPAWMQAGIWVVHLTGENDPDALSLSHPHYFPLPFFDNMAALLQRADLAVSRAGAGTLTELAIAQTPAILIPYPFAAEDHQTYNARVFADAGGALLRQQSDLTVNQLQQEVLDLLGGTHANHSKTLEAMKAATASLAVPDSATRLAQLILQSFSG